MVFALKLKPTIQSIIYICIGCRRSWFF